ncbi:NADH-cytochrome b5 reductase (MCR1) [Vairimorpha necatrix]|uniref:NADH-cytochrome b5 reductase (MCR1) n=1 Tax=Vairimorpha necatrix TaxID=6039 RepID=A0AAX4JDY4_9MICR
MDVEVKKCKIVEKYMISQDTIFIKVSSEEFLLNNEVSFFVYIYNDSQDFFRPYTPVSWKHNEINFVIKKYPRNGISEMIHNKNIGDEVNISKSIPKLKYNENKKNILMISAGTGITPMLQILKKEQNIGKFTIIDCNRTFDDILINRNIINKDIKIFYILNKEKNQCVLNKNLYFIKDDEENIIKERLTKQLLEKILKELPSRPEFVYVCGPPGFMKSISGEKLPNLEQGELTGMLKELGFTSDEVYKF